MRTFFISVLGALALTACTASTDRKSAPEAIDTTEENAVEVDATDFSGTPDPITYERKGGVIEYEGATMGEYISPDNELPVVIDFNATWCGPCMRFKPTFEKVASEYDGAVFLSVDVDNNPKAAEQFGVTNIPMITVHMPDGTTQTYVGYMEEDEFRKFLGI